MSKTKRRPSVVLDAGYVSIKANDRWKSSNILGLQGKKLFCVIFIALVLFLISCLNLACLIWIMYKLDWSPLDRNGSKIFRIDGINRQIEFYHPIKFQETIYTTKINDLSPMNISSNEQIDMYGDHNSILLVGNQIAMNTEYFHLNNHSLVDFNHLHRLKFDKNRTTRIHLDQMSTQQIQSNQMNLFTDHNLTILDVNYVLFTGQNLTLRVNRYHRRSTISFNNHPRRKNSFHHRQKGSYGNINFQINSISLNLPKQPLIADTNHEKFGVYRVCICNTTFLLLRSFAHQPCPLC